MTPEDWAKVREKLAERAREDRLEAAELAARNRAIVGDGTRGGEIGGFGRAFEAHLRGGVHPHTGEPKRRGAKVARPRRKGGA